MAKKSTWEFIEMVKAAIYGATDDRNIDTEFDDSDEFADFAYEVYLVIERRIRESDTVRAWGVPRQGKERAVKTIAREKYEAGFEDEKANMRPLYMAVPSSTPNRLAERQEGNDTNPYQYDGGDLY